MTFSSILADIYRRTGFATSPPSDVVTRIKAFVNETQQEIFHEPGMENLQNDATSFSSVASQPQYGLPPSVAKIKTLWETTNRLVLLPMSLGEYHERYPDPAAVTGTPTRWVDLGFDAVDVEPADASAVYAVSSSASDTGTAYIEGLRSGGVPFSDSVTMTGATAVVFPLYSDIVSITKFYISAVAVGTVRLREDSGAGTILATIPVGYAYSRYRRIALAPTPAAAISYSLEFERNITDLVNDTDEPLLPSQFHHLLAIGGRMKEYEKTQDIRYNLARGEFDKGIRKLKFWLYEQAVGTPNLRGARISRPSIMDGGSIPASGGSAASPLAASAGGTGFSSYTIGDLLYADTTTTLAKLAAVADGRFLRAFGVAVAPQWSTLTIPNTLSANRIPYATAANVLGSSADFIFDGTTLSIGGTETTVTIGGVLSTLKISVHDGSGLIDIGVHEHADTAGIGPTIDLFRSHGSESAETVVSADDTLGAITWLGHDGTDYEQSVVIRAEVDAAPGAGDMPGRLLFLTTADGSATPTERMRIASSGTITLAGNLLFTDNTYDIGANGATRPRDLFLSRLLDLSGAAAGQIKFPGTQNSSANVNTLDDYEEGTWTPVIGGAGGTSGQTYAANGQVGRYTKIGNLVVATFRAELSAKGTITGNVQIQGLPFTAMTVTNYLTVAPLLWVSLATNWVDIVARVQSNTAAADVSGASAAAASNATALTTTDIADATILAGTIIYLAAT